jgi:protein subunit release factor B
VPAPASPESLRASYRLPEGDDGLLRECEIAYFRASGPGGQHRNKTLTAVRLRHLPSGIVVIGKRERSQGRNLAGALARLRTRLEAVLTPPKARRKTRPTRTSREKRLTAKRRRSLVKRERRAGPSE